VLTLGFALQLENGKERIELLRRQAVLVASLAKCAKEFSNPKEPRPDRVEELRSFLADSRNNLLSMDPISLPLNGNVEVVGIIPEKASILKSNSLLLYFNCSDGSEYPVIFKDGDDLRQDQLVIQLFTLMDRLLRQENLDVKLTPCPVLVTGPRQGMMQFIPSNTPSKTIADILSEHGSILNYMRAHHPDDSEGSVGTYGIDPVVLDTFVRSCGKCAVDSQAISLTLFASQRAIVSSPIYWVLGITILTICSSRQMVRPLSVNMGRWAKDEQVISYTLVLATSLGMVQNCIHLR
jgi:phosphatidylinositol 3-kinase